VRYGCTRDCWWLSAAIVSLVIVVVVLGGYFGVTRRSG